MSKRNLLDNKDRRRQRRSLKFLNKNPIAKDLGTPKYHQRIVERKRIESDDIGYFFADRFHEDEVDW